MQRPMKRAAMGLGSLALIAALAPAPQAPVEGGRIKTLAEARVKVGLRILDVYKERRLSPPAGKDGPSPIEVEEQIRFWSRQIVDARLEATDRREERVTILAEEVARARAFEEEMRAIVEGRAAGVSGLSVDKAEFHRLELESRLAKEQAGR